MSHKYNIGDIIFDNRFKDYLLVINIGPDELFGVQSYLLARIYGNNTLASLLKDQYYSEVRAVDRSNEFTLVA